MAFQRLIGLILLLLTSCGTIAEAPVMPLTAVAPQSAAEPKAPYLYYYSAIYDRFIIERADGTDGMLLGTATGSPYWSAWSPSGAWLMWYNGGYCPQNQCRAGFIHAIRSDNHDQKLIFSFRSLRDADPGSVEATAWSPVSDDLLIAGELDGNSFVRLFKVSTGTESLYYELPEEHQGAKGFQWLPDGQSFLYTLYDGIVAVRLDGSRYVIENARLKQVLPDGRLLAEKFNSDTPETYLFLVDMQQETRRILEMGAPLTWRETGFRFVWNEASTYALVYLVNAGFEELWLFSVADSSITLILKNAVFIGEMVDTPRPMGLWLEDDTRALILDTDRNFWWLYADTGERSPAGVLPAAVPSVWAMREITRFGQHLLLTWEIENHEYRSMFLNSQTDAILQAALDLAPDDTRQARVMVSPDEQYLLYAGGCEGGEPYDWITYLPYCLVDLPALTQQQGMMSSAVVSASPGYSNLNWSADNAWFLVSQYGGMSSTGWHWSIVHASTNHQRELTSEMWASWLPDRVDTRAIPARTAPLQVTPVQHLADRYYSDGVGWSSNGTRIAASTEMGITVWDVATGEVVRHYETPTMGGDYRAVRLTWGDNDTTLNILNRHRLDLATGVLEENVSSPSAPVFPPALAFIAETDYRDSSIEISAGGRYLSAIFNTEDANPAYWYDRFWIFDTATGDEVVQPPISGFYPGNLARFSPDERYVVYLAGLEYPIITLQSLETGAVIFQTYGAGLDVAWSLDSRFFATAGIAGVYIWEVPEEQP